MIRALALVGCLGIVAGCGDDVGTGGAGSGAGGAAAGGATTTTGGAGGAGGTLSVGGNGTGGTGTGGIGTGGAPPTLSCNPVTNGGCDTQANEACDFNGNGGFQCFPDNNTAGLCEPCSDGMWCLGGTTCTNQDQKCAKFCCDDADCGPGATCEKDAVIPEIGICLTAAMTSDCEAPLVSPSMGGCYMPL